MGESKFFMLYVDGQTSPTNKHSNEPEAIVEAERLLKKTGKKVYVLSAVCALEPKTEYNRVDFNQ